jgi:hypothetical protein
MLDDGLHRDEGGGCRAVRRLEGFGRARGPADTPPMKRVTWTDSSWVFLLVAVLLLFARAVF